MAWTDPNTYIAGAILTAAQMNAMQANALAGGPIYATEAARTTAIPSPFEGQRAYITGSTVAAATGLVTAVPTGIQTIYNGAAWVCLTPVGADTATAGTTASPSYTATLASGGTNPSVTVSTGTSALVTVSVDMKMAGTTSAVFASFAVSGATTLAASDTRCARFAVSTSGFGASVSIAIIVTGLTAGTNTFALNYKSGDGAITGTFATRSIIVQGIA